MPQALSAPVCGSQAPAVNTQALHLRRNNPFVNISETTGPPTPHRSNCLKLLFFGFSFSSLYGLSSSAPNSVWGVGWGSRGRPLPLGTGPLIPRRRADHEPRHLQKSTTQSPEVFRSKIKSDAKVS